MVNGPDQVFVERRGKLELTNVRFRDDAHVAEHRAADRHAGRPARSTRAAAWCDARLRTAAASTSSSRRWRSTAPAISIRKFAKKRIDLDVAGAAEQCRGRWRRVLEIAARCRLNIVISGGTGSGKTTMLNAMSRLIDHGERIVTIEDAAELQLQQPHVVRLETRPANLEGRGEITSATWCATRCACAPTASSSARCAAREAFDMLQAMNTGHDGSMCTVHANTTRDALTRIENMVLMGQSSAAARAIRTQIVGAVDLIVQIERMRDGVRRVTQVTEVVGLEGDVITMNDLFTFEYEGENRDGTLLGKFVPAPVRPYFVKRAAYFGLERPLMAAMQG